MLFVSERIYLRPLEPADAASLLAMTENEEIRYMTGTKAHFTIDQIVQHIKIWDEDPSRYDFAICLNSNNEMIGDIALFEINHDDKKAAFRIAMHEMELTGQGYGSEAIRIIIHFVFHELKLNRLQLEVYSHNKRAIRAYERLGFVREGVLRQSLHYKGKYSDEVIMSLLKSDIEAITK